MRTEIAKHMDQLTSMVKKDAQQTAELALHSYSSLSRQLNNKVAEIQQAEEDHRAQQHTRLQQYKDIFNKTKPMEQVGCRSSICHAIDHIAVTMQYKLQLLFCVLGLSQLHLD